MSRDSAVLGEQGALILKESVGQVPLPACWGQGTRVEEKRISVVVVSADQHLIRRFG